MSVRQIFQNYNFFIACPQKKKSPSCHYIFFYKKSYLYRLCRVAQQYLQCNPLTTNDNLFH